MVARGHLSRQIAVLHALCKFPDASAGRGLPLQCHPACATTGTVPTPGLLSALTSAIAPHVDSLIGAGEFLPAALRNQVMFGALGGCLGLFIGLVVNLLLARFTAALKDGALRRAFFSAWVGPVRWMVAVLGGYLGVVGYHAWDGGMQGLSSFLSRASANETNLFLLAELPFVTVVALRLVDGFCDRWVVLAQSTEDTFDDQLVPLVRQAGKTTLLIAALLLGSQAVGWDVTSLLTGLGIGGAAIALASKDTIANLFGSVVVFVDRPFQVGDWVELSGQEGTVEEVGLRTTRIRTFANSVITLPNSVLTTSAINNWSRMNKRRIKLTIGVTYDANAAQLRAGVTAIRDLLAEDSRIDQSFSLVNFTDFGPSSLDIFVYCFTTTTQWAEYMETRQDILLQMMERLQALGLSFAFPSQSLYLESLPQGSGGPLETGRG